MKRNGVWGASKGRDGKINKSGRVAAGNCAEPDAPANGRIRLFADINPVATTPPTERERGGEIRRKVLARGATPVVPRRPILR